MEQEKAASVYYHQFIGVPLSEGCAEGSLWHVLVGSPRPFPQHTGIPVSMIAGEVAKMRQAVQIVSLVMENSICQVMDRLGQSYAQMFVAFREMLHDPMLLSAFQEHIEKKLFDAGGAIATVLESFRKKLIEGNMAVLRERADDLLELQSSLLDALDSAQGPCGTANVLCPRIVQDGKSIAVVETLTPRLVLDLKNTEVCGIVCEFAGPTSHAAILCRAFQIPAIAGIENIRQELPENEFAVIDGKNGTIVRGGNGKMFREPVNRVCPVRDKTIDLSNVKLLANLSLSQNAITALAAGAEGIGLYRTEFEFIFDNKLLSKQEQFLRYRSVVVAMMGFPVTIRLLDVSADKAANVFGSGGGNAGPSCFGALFLLSRPELLETQAIAIAQASLFGPVRVLYPMVSDARQFLLLKRAFTNAVGEEMSAKIKHGTMIEQPSAVDDAREIFDTADFACLGTNDLIQSLLHVDRETAIDHDENILQSPLLWDAIDNVASAAFACGKDLTVCGEMASNLDVLPRFIAIGIKRFSMDIPKIRYLRNRVI